MHVRLAKRINNVFAKVNESLQLRFEWVANSTVEYSAFNRFVPGSNPGQPIKYETDYWERASIQCWLLFYVQETSLICHLKLWLSIWYHYG